MNRAERAAVPPSAAFCGSDVSEAGSGVLAPEKPAQGLDTIEHLDFDPEIGCEVTNRRSGPCGQPITHRLSAPCGHGMLVCSRHADVFKAKMAGARRGICHACGWTGRPGDVRVVAL